MNKITLALFSFFVLAACSEDVYRDIDKQNNGLETGNNSDSKSSGGYAPLTIAPDYESLWDINTRGQHEMYYRFDNWTGDWGNPGRLDFRITPLCGVGVL